MTPGLVAFFVLIALLLAFYALIAPTNKSVTYTNVRKATPKKIAPFGGDIDENFDEEPPFGSQDLSVDKDTGLFERFIRPAIRNFLPQTPAALTEYAKHNRGIEALLAKTGNPWRTTPEEYVGLRVLSVIAGVSLAVFLTIFKLFPFPLYIAVPFGLAFGFILPSALLSMKWSARRRDLRANLPEALDLLRICMNSGQNFPNALKQTVELLPPGTTKDELARMSAELSAGRTLYDALSSLAFRCPTDGIEAFTRIIQQATETGTDISQTLAYQSDEIRAEYERIIETRAQKLQTTLFFPIILLLLPALMIFLFGPALSALGTAL